MRYSLTMILGVLACLSLWGCSTTAPLWHEHNVGAMWPQNPHDIDELVQHMDEKINLNHARIQRLEDKLYLKCECDEECSELLGHMDDAC